MQDKTEQEKIYDLHTKRDDNRCLGVHLSPIYAQIKEEDWIDELTKEQLTEDEV